MNPQHNLVKMQYGDELTPEEKESLRRSIYFGRDGSTTQQNALQSNEMRGMSSSIKDKKESLKTHLKKNPKKKSKQVEEVEDKPVIEVKEEPRKANPIGHQMKHAYHAYKKR